MVTWAPLLVLYGNLVRPPGPRWWRVSWLCLTTGLPEGPELPLLDCQSQNGSALSPQGSVWLAVCGALRQDVDLLCTPGTDPPCKLVLEGMGPETAR